MIPPTLVNTTHTTNMDKNRTSTTFASYNNNNNASLLNPNNTFRTNSNNMTGTIPINANSIGCDSYQCKNCFKVEVL